MPVCLSLLMNDWAQIAFAAVACLVPIIALVRAYWRYLKHNIAERNDLVRIRISLLLISLSTIAWLINWGLISIDEDSRLPRAVIEFAANYRLHGPFGWFVLVNLILGLLSLSLCWFKRAANPSTARVKRAISLACEVMLVLWALLAANPH